eukprot:1658582-Amphidinium_carterae.1
MEGKDRLSYFSYGNVASGSWLYVYLTPIVTWYVTLVWPSSQVRAFRALHCLRLSATPSVSDRAQMNAQATLSHSTSPLPNA